MDCVCNPQYLYIKKELGINSGREIKEKRRYIIDVYKYEIIIYKNI